MKKIRAGDKTQKTTNKVLIGDAAPVFQPKR